MAANVQVAPPIMAMKFMTIVRKQGCNRIEVTETSIQGDADMASTGQTERSRLHNWLRMFHDHTPRIEKNSYRGGSKRL
jgi:hypothetical protein